MRDLFEGGHYYAQLWDCEAPIRGRLLIGVQGYSGGYYGVMNTISRAGSIRGRPLLRSALGLCGAYSRAATNPGARLFNEIGTCTVP